jgi:hypothetical protein
MINNFTETGGTITLFNTNQMWQCTTQTTSEGYITLLSCKLREAVSLELKGQYRNVPFLFPFQHVSNTQFAKEISGSGNIDTSLTTKLTNVDKAFIFFLENNNTSTVRYVNPFIRYHVLINGEYYHADQFGTVDDVRHYNQVIDALNYEGSNTFSINKDVLTSMQPYTKVVTRTIKDSVATNSPVNKWNCGARSNFFIVIPFADTNMFQSGINTGDTQIVLKAYHLLDTGSKRFAVEQAYLVTTSDVILKIRSEIPQGGGSQFEIVWNTIDQMAPVNFEHS